MILPTNCFHWSSQNQSVSSHFRSSERSVKSLSKLKSEFPYLCFEIKQLEHKNIVYSYVQIQPSKQSQLLQSIALRITGKEPYLEQLDTITAYDEEEFELPSQSYIFRFKVDFANSLIPNTPQFIFLSMKPRQQQQ